MIASLFVLSSVSASHLSVRRVVYLLKHLSQSTELTDWEVNKGHGHFCNSWESCTQASPVLCKVQISWQRLPGHTVQIGDPLFTELRWWASVLCKLQYAFPLLESALDQTPLPAYKPLWLDVCPSALRTLWRPSGRHHGDCQEPPSSPKPPSFWVAHMSWHHNHMFLLFHSSGQSPDPPLHCTQTLLWDGGFLPGWSEQASEMKVSLRMRAFTFSSISTWLRTFVAVDSSANRNSWYRCTYSAWYLTASNQLFHLVHTASGGALACTNSLLMRKLTHLLFLAGFLKKTDLIHVTSEAASEKYL